MSEKQQKRVVIRALDAGTITQLLSKMSAYQRCPTLMDSVSKSIEQLKSEKVLETSKAYVADAYGNKLTATGNKDKVSAFNNYEFTNTTLNYYLWTALYQDSWVFKRVIDKPADDILKLGIVLKMKDKQMQSKIEKDYHDCSDELSKIYKWGALYGGSIGIVMFDTFDDNDYAEPISNNKEKIRHATRIHIYATDRWYGIQYDTNDVVDDKKSIDYGKPKSYTITMANGSTLTVHHDYILRYEHRQAPNFVKNGLLMGWGYAEGSHILHELQRDDQLKADITSLINKSLIEVVKMTGMTGLFLGEDSESQAQIEARLSMINAYRSFNSLTFLDKDDEYQMNSFGGLGGLSDLLEKNMWLVAAACDMQGILFGDLKNGMGNDSDALVRYDDVIQTRANSLCRTCTEKFLQISCIRHNIEDTIDFEFGSLRSKQNADERNKRLDNHISRLNRLLADGIISIAQYAKSLKKFNDTETVDFFIDDNSIKEAEQRAKEEEEGFNPNV